MRYWTSEQEKLLKMLYQRTGDAEVARIFKKYWPEADLFQEILVQ